MNIKKTIFGMMILALLFLTLAPVLPAQAQNGPQDTLAPAAIYNSAYAATPPVLDGSLNFGEWDYANKITLPHGSVGMRNDSNRLYILLDMTAETANDAGDYFWVVFDKDKDGVIDAGQDLLFGTDPNTGNIRYSYFNGPGSVTGLQPTTYSARAKGFDCFWADGSFAITSFFPLSITCNRHRVWELGIDLGEIGAFAGGSAKVGIRAAGVSPAFADETPSGLIGSFTNLNTVNLGSSGLLTLAPFPGAVPAFDENLNAARRGIEITQAVQNRGDTEPLVDSKDTVARVYTITGNVPFPQWTRTYLYATTTGAASPVDLPGSPMVISQNAPTVINRLNLNDTANFKLPPSWTTGSVTFQAKAVDTLSHTAATSNLPIAFQRSRVLTVWIIPVNTGTTASPVLPTQADIDLEISYMRAAYPIARIDFVQKPWTALGVVTGDPIPPLNTYFNSLALGYILSCLFGACPNFALPDQVFGFMPSGGGNSDPVWYNNGEGYVAYGWKGTSLEGTMAHEINHNLDKKVAATWGHHTPFGCGATGPDPSWPYVNAQINEVGFDTRAPWSTAAAHLTVVPNTVPDLMSYCQSGILPTKWISPYRWENLFNNATKASLASLQSAQSVSVTTNIYKVGGKLTLSGKTVTGKLSPVWQQPLFGSLTPDDPAGNFSLKFLNGATVVSTFHFHGEFNNDPEEPTPNIFFNFTLPEITGTPLTAIELVNNSNEAVLDTIPISSTPLTITVNTPAGGETWSGTQNLNWTVNNAPASDTFNVLFSKDGGATWDTLATNLAGVTDLSVDTTLLPNTANALIKVQGTDGFNSAIGTSGIFSISNAGVKPTVHITTPGQNLANVLTNAVELAGTGQDPTDGPLPDDHLTWYEGQTVLGSGSHIDAVLSNGAHTLTLQGVNSTGQIGTASITVLVGLNNRLYLPTINH